MQPVMPTTGSPSRADRGTPKRQPFGLRGTLALTFAAMAGAVALTLGLVFSEWSAGQARHDQGQGLATLAHSYIDQLDHEMATRSGEIAILGQMLQSLGPQDAAGAQTLLDRVQDEFPAYSWMGVADVRGRVVTATHGVLAGADVSARPWFRSGSTGRFAGDVHEAVLLAHLLGNPGSEPPRFVDVAIPLRDAHGALNGVLGAHFDWRWARSVDQTVGAPLAGRNSVDLLVISRDGVVLHGPRRPGRQPSRAAGGAGRPPGPA